MGNDGAQLQQRSSGWTDMRVQVRNGWVGGLWQGLGRKTGKGQRGVGNAERCSDVGEWCRCPGAWAVWRVLSRLLRLQGSCGMWVRTVSQRLTLGVLGVQVFGRTQRVGRQAVRQHATELPSVTSSHGRHVCWLAGRRERGDCGTAKGNQLGE